ncbi:DUF6689 family protein [Dokdonella sp.]|uniref:DUF6689 family protein n=1 Tax=Dokdonella sp. TaxID=2291710 RepID=UPI0035283A44
MLTHRTPLLLLLTLVAFSAMAPFGHALAGGPCIVETSIVDDRKFKADICLPNPNGPDFEMGFDLEFHLDPENPGSLVNLTVPCVGFSVEVMDAAAIADVESRLPDPANQSIDPALPLRVTIEPPVACGLEFEDDYDAEFDADNLVWNPQSPYRLMKAPIGGSYRNITAQVDAGSVRARGCGGTFSEFVLVVDQLQDYASETVAAFADLGITIGNAAIGPTASTTLGNDRSVSQSAFAAGNYAEAIARLDDMDAHCGALGGPALPNRWRSARDLENLEGEVVSRSGHLKFLLGRLNGDP